MVFIRNNIGAGGEFVVHGCVVADVIMGGQEGICNSGVGWVLRHPSAELRNESEASTCNGYRSARVNLSPKPGFQRFQLSFDEVAWIRAHHVMWLTVALLVARYTYFDQRDS